MRTVFKIMVAPFALVLGLVYGLFKFVVMIGGTVISIVAILVAILSTAMMFFSGFWYGLAWLAVAAVVFALPYLAAMLVGAFGALNGALWEFIRS